MPTHKGTQTIETSRLILRRAVREDAEPMFRNWASDPEVTKFLTWPAHSIPAHLDIAITVYTLDGAAGSGRDGVRIFTHGDQLQPGAGWIVQAGHRRPSLFFSCHTFPPF